MDSVASRIAKAFLLKDPKKVLRGETIEAKKVAEYKREVDHLAKSYRAAKAKLDAMESGKAKGMAGHELSKIGEAGRKARMRLEIAEQLKRRGITKAEF